MGEGGFPQGPEYIRDRRPPQVGLPADSFVPGGPAGGKAASGRPQPGGQLAPGLSISGPESRFLRIPPTDL